MSILICLLYIQIFLFFYNSLQMIFFLDKANRSAVSSTINKISFVGSLILIPLLAVWSGLPKGSGFEK